MITRKVLALPNVVQQAAPGNVSTHGLLSGVLSFWIKQGTTGRGGIRGRSREPPADTR
jgi:hypothetical protein